MTGGARTASPLWKMIVCGSSVPIAANDAAGMPKLRDKRLLGQIREHAIELNRLEREADETYRRALETLIATSRNDWFEFTRWKDIYEKLEDVTDSCEDIADVLQVVVLKNA